MQFKLTSTQRFAISLRPTLAAPADTEEERIQRFLCWWLLYGRTEYPSVWHYTPDQVTMVMSAPVNQLSANLPALVLRMHEARSDVAYAFPLGHRYDHIRLLCWYRLFAGREFGFAPSLPPEFLDLTEDPIDVAQVTLPAIAEALHDSTPGLRDLFDLANPNARRAFGAWFEKGGRELIPAPVLPISPTPQRLPIRGNYSRGSRSGVNLVGFATAEFGVGEDVRSLSVALEAAGVAHCILNFVPVNARLQDESRRHLFDRELRYATTIFCVTAFDTAQLFLEHGPELFEGRRAIGYWPWEFDRFPMEWNDTFALVDEVWAASAMQEKAFRAPALRPTVLMPPAIRLPRHLPARRAKKNGRFRVLFPFDPNSFLSRKNPISAIRNFRIAFPSYDRKVSLTLRVNGRLPAGSAARALRRAAAADSRIKIIERTLSRREALRDTAQYDLLLSPHRAEGLGRNLAEAIALRVAVLGTGGSGNSDFMMRSETIPFRQMRVLPGDYPHAVGLTWAEPNPKAMVQALRRARNDYAKKRSTWYSRRAATLLRTYGPRPAGRRYRDRLAALGVKIQ